MRVFRCGGRAAVTLATCAMVACVLNSGESAGLAQPAVLDTAPGLVVEAGGLLQSVASEGDRAYVAHHSRVLVYSATSDHPETPIGVSKPLGGRLQSIAVRRDVVIAVGQVLTLLDTRDPQSIDVVSTFPLRPPGGQAIIVGDEVWIAQGVAGVLRVDVSNPAKPRSLGHWMPSGAQPGGAPTVVSIAAYDQERALLILGTMGRIAPDEDSCRLLSVRRVETADPTVADRITLSGCTGTLAARKPWIVLGSSKFQKSDAQLYSVGADGELRTLELLQTRVSGANTQIVGASIRGDALWVSNLRGEVLRIDLGSREKVAQLLRAGDATGYFDTRGLAIVGDQALLIGPNSGSWITRGLQELTLSGLDATDFSFGAVDSERRDVWILGSDATVFGLRETAPEAWSLSSTGLVMYGAINAPRFGIAAGLLFVPRLRRGQDPDIAVAEVGAGGEANMIDAWGLEQAGDFDRINILDVSEHALAARMQSIHQHPSDRLFLRSAEARSDDAQSIMTFERLDRHGAIDGDTLWITTVDAGVRALRAVDISDLTRPEEIPQASRIRGYSIGPLDAHDGLVVLGDRGSVVLLDSDDPTRPVIDSVADVQGTVLDADLDGRHLWVSWAGSASTGLPSDPAVGGLTVFDVSDPTWPSELGTVPLGALAPSVSASGGVAWVNSEAVQGFSVGEESGPATPTSLAGTPSPEPATPSTPTPTQSPEPAATPETPQGVTIHLPSLSVP